MLVVEENNGEAVVTISGGGDDKTENSEKDLMSMLFFESAADGDCDGVERMIIDSKIDANLTDVDGFTALMIAAAEKQENVVNLLLSKDADVEARTLELGSVALHFAAKSGNPSIIKSLCERSPNSINVVNVNEDTPLVWACIEGRDEAVKVLLEYGADVSVTNHYGATTIMCATMIGENAEEETDAARARIVKMLLKKEPSLVNVQDTDGSTAMHLAAACGRLLCVKELLKGGADITIRNAIGQTPLEEAEQTGCKGSEACVDHLRVKWRMLEEEAAARMLSMLETEEKSSESNDKKREKKKSKKSKKSKRVKGKKEEDTCSGKQDRSTKDMTVVTPKSQSRESSEDVSEGIVESDEVEEMHCDADKQIPVILKENVVMEKGSFDRDAIKDDGLWTTVGRKSNPQKQNVSTTATTTTTTTTATATITTTTTLDGTIEGSSNTRDPSQNHQQLLLHTKQQTQQLNEENRRNLNQELDKIEIKDRDNKEMNDDSSSKKKKDSVLSVDLSSSIWKEGTAEIPTPPGLSSPFQSFSGFIGSKVAISQKETSPSSSSAIEQLFERKTTLPNSNFMIHNSIQNMMYSDERPNDSLHIDTRYVDAALKMNHSTPVRRIRPRQYVGNPKIWASADREKNRLATPRPTTPSWACRAGSGSIREALSLLSCGICKELVSDNVECSSSECSALFCRLCIDSIPESFVCGKCSQSLDRKNCRHNKLAQQQSACLGLHSDTEESTADLQTSMYESHPLAASVAITPRHMVPTVGNVGLCDLSMGQLDVLEDLHHQAIRGISQAKLQLIRLQERMRLQEELKTQRDINLLNSLHHTDI